MKGAREGGWKGGGRDDNHRRQAHKDSSKFLTLLSTLYHPTAGACKHSFLLATFLGLYSGTSCAAEKTIGRRNWATSFVGGFSAGTFAGLTTGHPHHAIKWGMGTGVASMIVYALQGGGP